MKVLYLDFDGVLNFYGAGGTMREDAPWWNHPEDIRMPFERHAIGYINGIYAATGCKIVVSSSWRLSKTFVQLQRSLKWYGCDAEVIGVTPDLVNERLGQHDLGSPGYAPGALLSRNRGHQADRYHLEFVILDDCSDMGRLLPCLVKTHPMQGLTVSEAAAVIERFPLSRFYTRLVRA